MSFGSILAHIGDAISVGSGGQPWYQNRIDRKEIGKGIKDYEEDPVKGLEAMAGVDPDFAQQYNKNRLTSQDNQQQNQIAAFQAKTAAEKQKEATDERSRNLYIGLLRSATPETWSQMHDMANRLAAKRGWEPDFQAPDQYDDKFHSSLTTLGLDPKDAEMADYHNRTLGLNTDKLGLDERRANAKNAIDIGNMKIHAAQVGSQAQQRAAQTGVSAAIGSGNTGVAAYRADHPRSGGRGGGAATTPLIAPPGKPSPGARKLDKLTHTVWYEKNGKWTHD